MSNGDPYLELADELSRMGHRLDRLGAQLRELRSSAAAPVGPGSAPVSARSRWEDARAGGGVASIGGPVPGPPLLPQQPPPPGPPADPGPPARRFPTLSGARLLAWTGGAVTLLGVAMLLVLAASRGWFSAGARVGAGALLGVGLVGLAGWLHRRESARTGALALAATGFATLYLVVAAATSLYGFLPVAPALVVAFVVAGAGLAVADRWRSQLLGTGAVAGAALLAPVLASDRLLVALVLALQLAALPVVLRRRWPVLMLVAAAGPVLFGSALGLLMGADDRTPTVVVVLGVLAVALATAAPAAALLPVRPVAVLVAAAPVPLLATGTALGGWSGGALIAVAAVALAALAAVPGTHRVIRIVAGTAAAVALFQATLVVLDGSAAVAVVLGQAIVAAVLAGALRARFPLFVAMAYGTYGALVALTEHAPTPVPFPTGYSVTGLRPDALLSGAGIAAMVLVLAVALLLAGGRVGLVRGDAASAGLWVPIGLVGLYGETASVVALAYLVAPDNTGFTTGHALVTVSWTVVALVLLARGISRPALRVAGMVLVASAVAKLVLFDLLALDGIARVGAFLGAGLVLLAAGTRYARLVAEADGPAVDGAAQPREAGPVAGPPLA